METGGRCCERLWVMGDDVPRSGAVNMALDEVIFSTLTDRAVLRLYTWAEPTVSFGYFEPVAAARHVARGRAIVRRWTGGGIVEHGEDVTYSLFVPRGSELGRLRSLESYQRIHVAVAAALGACGTPVQASATPTTLAPTATPLNACFDRPVAHDLLLAGRKIAGGAQRRSRAGLLHQGSIRIDLLPEDVNLDLRRRLTHALPAAFSAFCEERPVAHDEVSRALALATSRYDSVAWTKRY